MLVTENLSLVVNDLIKNVKAGRITREEALREMAARDVYVNRGTARRLLCAEADAILNADHPHYRAK